MTQLELPAAGVAQVEFPLGLGGRCGVLPAGTYELEVESDGHTTFTCPITIRSGQATSIDVTLRR